MLPELVHEGPSPQPPPRPTDSVQIAGGEVLYNRYCGRCHAFGRAVLPDLRRMDRATQNIFDLIVRGGAYASKGMGRFDDVPSSGDVQAIHAYLIDQAWKLKEVAQKESALMPH